MRNRAPLLALLALAVVPVTVSAISTIKAISLDDGYDDINRLTAPVVDPATAPRVEFTVTGAFDRGAKIVRRGANGLFTRGPEYNLDKAVDLAGLLSQALKTEAAAMGFRTGRATTCGKSRRPSAPSFLRAGRFHTGPRCSTATWSPTSRRGSAAARRCPQQ